MRRVLSLLALLTLFCQPAAAAESTASESTAGDERFQAMADRYHRVLTRRPRKGTALDLLYRHYLDAGKLDGLVTHYEQLAAKEPNDAAAHLMLGLIYERRGRHEEALQSFNASASLANDDHYAPYAAALLLVRQHRHEEAIKAFRQSLNNKPERVQSLQIYKTLGRLHLWQGDQPAALKVWSEAADAFPDDRFALEELAELLAEEEQFDEAIKRYEQLVELSDQDLYKQLTARVEIGQIQVRQGKLDTAIATFESCLDRVKPDSWNAEDIRRRIEEIFVRADDLDGLATYYQERLKKHSDDLAAMIRLAATFGKLNKGDEALQQYRAAVKLAPTRDDIREKLIRELTRQENFVAAIEQAETLAQQKPNDTEHLRRLGSLYVQAAAPGGATNRATAEAKALAVWKRIAAAKPNDPLAALQTAELCRKAAGIGSRLTTSAEPEKFQQMAKTPLGTAALAYYVEAIRRAPGVPQYHEYHGEYLFAIGQVDEALAAWAKLAEPPQDSVENLKRLSQVYAGADRLEEAVEAIRRAIAKESDRYDLHRLAADLLIRQDRYDEALQSVAAMEQAADAPLLLEQALRKRVEVYGADGRLAAESKKLATQLATPGVGVRDWWLAAMLAAAERRSALALNHLEQALKLEPEHSLLLRFKAEVHRQGGDLAGAAAQYQRLAELEPKSRTVHLKSLVAVELELGRLDRALEAAQQILRLAPANTEAAQLLSDVYFRAGEDQQALETLRQALRSDPRNTGVRLILARRLIERQQLNEAIEHLWRTFELTEDREGKIAVVGNLADQYAIVGRSAELIERLARLRSQQEDPVGTTLYLVEAYSRAEDYVSARRELSALLARRGDDVQVLAQLVAISEQLGDSETALQYQQQIVERAPNAASLARLAQLYSDAGDTDRAKEVWRRLAREAKDEKTILTAVDRAMGNGDYEYAIVLAEPEWTERSDDWRFGYRLAMAYWHHQQRGQAVRVAKAVSTLLPSTKYEKPPATTPAGQTPRAAIYRQYPPIIMRVSAPQMIRMMLAESGSRTGYGGFFGWQPAELLDAQMFCSILMCEVARVEKRQDSYVKELRDRTDSDLGAIRQLVWIGLSEQKLQGLESLLEKWIAENPSDAEPRLGLFILPFMSARGPSDMSASEEQLARAKSQYEWFVANRPALGRFLAAPYAQMLTAAGKEEEAAGYLRDAITGATNVTELMMAGQMGSQMRDIELVELMITRLEQLSKGSSTAMGQSMLQELLRSYTQLVAKEKDWEKLLASFDRYMAATHPKTIRPTSLGATVNPGSYGPSYGSAPSYRPPGQAKSLGPFPGPSGWLDAGRVAMLTTAHKALRAAGEEQKLAELIDSRATETEGVTRQCWTLCRVFLYWLEGEQDEAIEHLAKFAEQTPGNTDLRLLLARAHAQRNAHQEALAVLESVHLPFGPQAKTVEQMRLQLARRIGNEEVGKQSALRLFGMRLTSGEQAELAKVMRGYGLATRSEELLKRAVQTASNKPAELYQLMQQNVASDQDRAVEIARMILRQTKRSSQPNDQNSRYRQEALKVFKRAGEFEPLVKKIEQQLAAAPNSITLMEDLVEYYTAGGEETKATAMIDRLLEARPNDAKLHFRIAQSLFRQKKYALGVERLGVVWEKEPQLVLDSGDEVGQHYARAAKLDLLAEHIAKLEDHPSVLQNRYQLSNIVENLQDNTTDVDGLMKVYRAAIGVMPEDFQGRLVRDFGQFLVGKGRKDDAYAVYKEHLVPKPDDEDADPSDRTNRGVYYSDGSLVTVPIQLAKLAHQIGKSDELTKEIEQAAAKHADWKPTGELIVAMLRRREQDEKPLDALGKRFVKDEKFAQSLSEHYGTLREELTGCKEDSTLRTALAVWKKGAPGGPDGMTYRMGDSDQIRIAEIHMKLREPDKARETLLAALEVELSSGFSGSNLAQRTFQLNVSIADALRTHGFHLDAVAALDQALRQVPLMDEDDYTRRNAAPQARQSMRESVAKVISEQLDETVAALIAELNKPQPQLTRFFAITDPQATPRDSRYGDPFADGPAVRAQSPAKASAQLLPAILRHAGTAGKLQAIEKLIAERLAQLDEKASENRDHLAALSVLATAAGDKPEQAAGPLKDWLKRTAEEKTLADRAETWLLALVALDAEPTRPTGQDLAVAVAKSALRRGDSARQKAAITALTSSSADSDALLEQIVTGSKSDPRTSYQIAQVYFQQKKYGKAVEALEVVWKQTPETLMGDLESIADYYVKANRLDALAVGIRAAASGNLRNNYTYEVANLFDELPRDPKYATQMVDLYFAGLEFSGADSADYATSQFAQYLRNLPRDANTLDVYRRVVFPSKQHKGQLESFATPLVELGKSTKQIAQLKTDCQKAVKDHPQWAAEGELLVAMLEQRAGNEEPLVQLAKNYKTDTVFAAALNDDASLLRQELTRCEGSAAAEVALELWRKETEGEDEYSASVTVQVARLMGKLDDREGARRVLSERLRRPVPIDVDSDNEEYYHQQTIQLKKAIGDELATLDFGLDALSAYREGLEIDVSGLPTSSYVRSRINSLRQKALTLIAKLASQQADQSLSQLEAALGGKEPERALPPFFLVFEGVPSSTSSSAAKPAGADSLLPPLLKYAAEKKRIDDLRQALAEARWQEARRQDTKDHHLVALGALLAMAAGDTDAAQADLKALASRVAQLPKLADDAVWLAAREAMGTQTTRASGHALAEAVAKQAASTGNSVRQRAAVLALVDSLSADGQEERADQLTQELIIGKKDNPEAQLQLAQIYFQGKKGSQAAEVLTPVWKSRPDLLLAEIGELLPLYAEAGAIDALAESIESVRDEELKNEYSSLLVNAVRTLSRNKSRVEETVKMFETTAKFVGSRHREYALSSQADYLASHDRKEQAWEVYREATIPSAGHDAPRSMVLTKLITLSGELDKFDDLEKAVREAAKAYPEWQSCADFILGVIELRKDKNEQPLVAVAERFLVDDDYALLLGNWGSVVRTEFGALDSQPALEVAAKLWQPIIEQHRLGHSQSSTAHRYFISCAEILVKLDRTEEARAVLLAAADLSMRGYSTSSIPYYMFQRRESLAPKLIEAGYPLDALRLFSQNVAMEGSPVATQRKLTTRIATQRKTIRGVVLDVLADHLDDSVEALRKSLTESPQRLEAFFATVSPGWTNAETERIPADVRNQTPSQTQLLPAALRRAQANGQLDSIAESVAAAISANPQDAHLKALKTFVDLARGSENRLPALIKLSKASDRDVRALAIAGLAQLPGKEAADAVLAAVSDAQRKLLAADPALNAASAALKAKPNDATLWFNRGNLYARRGQWQNAADDFTKGLDLDGSNHWNWNLCACLQLQLGNKKEYDRLCRELLRRFGQTDQPMIAERVAKICMIATEPVDSKLPKTLSEMAVASDPKSNIYHWILLSGGIVEYRTGRFEQAVEKLQKSLDMPRNKAVLCQAADHLFLAMAQHQLGKSELARAEYQQGKKILADLPTPSATTQVGGWNDWVLAQAARTQAEKLLKIASP